MSLTKNGFATILLTVPLSPDREEYVRPLTVQEFRRLQTRLSALDLRGPGELMEFSIVQLMHTLETPEEEAFRIFTLLHRDVQMNYAIEGFLARGIRVATCYDPEYPSAWKASQANLPPVCFLSGNTAILKQHAVGIMSIGGVKTTEAQRHQVRNLTEECIKQGFAIVTGGEPGLSAVAAEAVASCGGLLIEIVPGDMSGCMGEPTVQRLLREGRCVVVCLEHPEALFTVSHAIVRARSCFVFSDAAFIANSDGNRGETEALNKRLCDWIYVLDDPSTQYLIARGAIPAGDIQRFDMVAAAARWREARYEQLSMLTGI